MEYLADGPQDEVAGDEADAEAQYRVRTRSGGVGVEEVDDPDSDHRRRPEPGGGDEPPGSLPARNRVDHGYLEEDERERVEDEEGSQLRGREPSGPVATTGTVVRIWAYITAKPTFSPASATTRRLVTARPQSPTGPWSAASLVPSWTRGTSERTTMTAEVNPSARNTDTSTHS